MGFSAGEMAGLRAMVEGFMGDSLTLYDPDYANANGGDPTLVVTVPCRVSRVSGGGGGNVLDPTGEATNEIHVPEGTAINPGQEGVVARTGVRYLILVPLHPSTYDYDTVVLAKRLTPIP